MRLSLVLVKVFTFHQGRNAALLRSLASTEILWTRCCQTQLAVVARRLLKQSLKRDVNNGVKCLIVDAVNALISSPCKGKGWRFSVYADSCSNVGVGQARRAKFC